MPQKIGYYRVSTAEQNADLQIKALKKAQCDFILGDKGISGCQRERPKFDQALSLLRPGDTLLIWRLDRMSRSLKHLIEINEILIERGAYFESLTEKIDTSSPMGEFVFHILGAVAQLEREIIRERTLAGLAVAAENGKCPGRPRKLTNEQLIWAAESHFTYQMDTKDIASELGVHQETIRRRFRELEISGSDCLPLAPPQLLLG